MNRKARFLELAGLFRDLYQIRFRTPPAGWNQAGVPPRRLRNSYLRLMLPKFLPSSGCPKQLKVLDYSIGFHSRNDVSQLFTEIFVYHRYYFEAASSVPFIIDGGSNIGLSILYFKTLYKDAQILGFEPSPASFGLLRENIAGNGLRGVTLFNKAISDHEGKAQLFGRSSTQSGLSAELGKNEGEVEVTRLSQHIDREVDFLKLDVEGAERSVFEDLASENRLRLIRQMIFEYHHHLKRDTDELARILGLLESAGFGYQVEDVYLQQKHPNIRGQYQDLIIYAYNKRSTSVPAVADSLMSRIGAGAGQAAPEDGT